MVLHVTTSGKESSWGMKQGSTITRHRVNARVWNGNILTRRPPPPPRHKNASKRRKVMLEVFWDSQGLLMEHYQETGTTVNSARYSVTCESLQFEGNDEDCCQKTLYCSTTMPVFTQLPTLLKVLTN